MYITHNITQSYQIPGIPDEAFTISKNYITNIANRLLKYTPLLTPMIQLGIVFSLGNSVESAVLRDETTTITQELDDVATVPINEVDANMMCGMFGSLC